MLLPAIMMLLYLILPTFNNGLVSFDVVYSQGQITNNTSPSPSLSSSSFQSKASILDNMPSQNITVGDINIAYKQIGKAGAKPIILITGGGATMDMWNPLLLEKLASANYKVIIFENRGVGESTAGKKEFSISQFANDTSGLLDALPRTNGRTSFCRTSRQWHRSSTTRRCPCSSFSRARRILATRLARACFSKSRG